MPRKNRNRSVVRSTVAAPSLLTQVITMLMHAPIAEARHVLEVGAAIVAARSNSPLTQPALPGTTAASATTTVSGAPRRKPGPKPKVVVDAANAAVDAATASATGGQPSPAAAAGTTASGTGKGPRRVPQNRLPGAGTRPPVPAGDDLGLPVGDAPLPEQGAGDDVEPVAVSEAGV